LARNPGFNVCFRVPRRVSSVEGHELFVRIIEAGLTRWETRNGEVSTGLYRSPDGYFTVFGTAEEGQIHGRGEQGHGGDSHPPHRVFLTQRVAPPRCDSLCQGIEQRWRAV